MNLLDHGYNLILVYLLGGLVGTLYETGLYLVRDHRFVRSNGSVTTPFNFVYGMGAVLVSFVLSYVWHWPWLVYLLSVVIGGAAEYLAATLEQAICHTRSWDYTGRVLSIQGKTTIPIMLLWGVMGLIVIYLFYLPLVFYVVEPYFLDTAGHAYVYHVVLIVLGSYTFLDLMLVLAVMTRHQKRHDHVPPKTIFGRFIDVVFDDRYVRKHFPNAKFKEERVPVWEKPKGGL